MLSVDDGLSEVKKLVEAKLASGKMKYSLDTYHIALDSEGKIKAIEDVDEYTLKTDDNTAQNINNITSNSMLNQDPGSNRYNGYYIAYYDGKYAVSLRLDENNKIIRQPGTIWWKESSFPGVMKQEDYDKFIEPYLRFGSQ